MKKGARINFRLPAIKPTDHGFSWDRDHVGPNMILGLGRLEKDSDLNQYLLRGQAIFLKKRVEAVCFAPDISPGNTPADDGQFLFAPEEKRWFVKKEPGSARWFRPWAEAEEPVRGGGRHRLFLADCPGERLRAPPECRKRVDAARKFRPAGQGGPTKKIAGTPTRLQTENFPSGDYLAAPPLSSQNWEYVPAGFEESKNLPADSLLIVNDAKLFHFGVPVSSVRMARARIVSALSGKSFVYDREIVCNNFPRPRSSATQVWEVEMTAPGVLDARKKYSGQCIDAIYDLLIMPYELVEAHEKNNKADAKARGFEYVRPVDNSIIVKGLLDLCQRLTR
jgi:hypothetical protein